MNMNLLRAAIAENGMNQAELAAAIGISANSLSRKMNGRRDFALSEVVAITQVLDLKAPQDIFLSQESHIRNKRHKEESMDETQGKD